MAGTGMPCEIVPARGLKLVRNRDIPAFVQESLPVLLAENEIAAIPALGNLGQSGWIGLQVTAEFQNIGL